MKNRLIQVSSWGLGADFCQLLYHITMKTNPCWNIVVFAVFIAGATVSYASPGDLDGSFGKGGKVVTDCGSNQDTGCGVAIQKDGKILVLSSSPGTGMDFLKCVLARYKANGDLDTAFGTGGKVAIPTSVGEIVSGGRIAIQSDGAILIAGGDFADFNLLRYTPGGSPDGSFGIGGKVNIDFGGNIDVSSCVVVQPDGMILVGGSADNGDDNDFALARLRPDGLPDPSFGNNGKVTADFGDDDQCLAIAVRESDGGIFATGYTGNDNEDFEVMRFDPQGNLDTGFGMSGRVTADFGGDMDRAASVMVQSDGKIVVAGTASAKDRLYFGLARYHDNGAPDAAFSGDGRVITAFGSVGDSANGAVLQPDGKIVAGGFTVNLATGGYDFAVARYTPDGTLDNTFHGNGKTTADFGGHESCYGLAMQRNGMLVTVGHTAANNGTRDLALARFLCAPEISDGHRISIQQSGGKTLKDGSSRINFGKANAGKRGLTRTFIIKNTGTANLSKIAVTKSGANPGNFIVSGPNKKALAPGSKTTFRVTFKPSAPGGRKAVIHILSAEMKSKPFDVILSGKGKAKASSVSPGDSFSLSSY